MRAEPQIKTAVGPIEVDLAALPREDLDYLLEAARELKRRGEQGFSILIVGDGAMLPRLRELATELELDDVVIFTGRVPHSEVEDYYSVVDIAPFPRKSLPVTEMVSPLKPFEAMAMNKLIISSDVAALDEIMDRFREAIDRGLWRPRANDVHQRLAS